MRLGQAMIFVHDVERMSAFYGGVLGLTLKDGAAAEGFVRFSDPSGGAIVALHQQRGGGPPSGEARTNANIKLCFVLDDRASVVRERARLEALGIKMRKTIEFDGITICDGEDPEGNVFQLTTRF